jgi:hypothetical protein
MTPDACTVHQPIDASWPHIDASEQLPRRQGIERARGSSKECELLQPFPARTRRREQDYPEQKFILSHIYKDNVSVERSLALFRNRVVESDRKRLEGGHLEDNYNREKVYKVLFFKAR